MKANQEQYNECVELYNKVGPSAVYEYAEKNGITSSSFCHSVHALGYPFVEG
jgi:hypothetical protein